MFSDEAAGDAKLTLVDIDFLAVRFKLDGLCLKIKNEDPLTAHVIAVWVITPENHTRYETDLFIRPGETLTYWSGIPCPSGYTQLRS